MITFEHDGRHYELEFVRKREEVELMRRHGKETAKVKKVMSKFPYTTAQLWICPKDKPRVLITSGRVGCCPKDNDCKRTGRTLALKRLSRILMHNLRNDKEGQQKLTAAIWDAYRKWELRNRTPSEPIAPKETVN